jgi:hypothetical protein
MLGVAANRSYMVYEGSRNHQLGHTPMSDATPQVLRAPKLFWQTRRLDGHRDWPFAFWRELFQNSVDAKARNIEIEIRQVVRSGVFDRPSPGGPVIQVVFADDGTGMTEDTIRNVFLEPGRSTKGNGSGAIGGFGTARTLLCFSQDRYEIHTNGLVVEGDGSEYILSSREVAARRASTHGLDRFAANIERFGGRKGCIFVIDVDPNESEYSWRNVNESQLRRKLFELLEMSDLKLESITLDGEKIEVAPLKKGQARTKLSATGFPDFGTVHVSRSDKATQKGFVVVRVNGLAMFKERVGLDDIQVVLELDASRTRQLLTDNRDGLKDRPGMALQEFLRELMMNRREALRDKSGDKELTLEGDLGDISVTPKIIEQVGLSLPSIEILGAESSSKDDLRRSTESPPVSGSSGSEHEGGKTNEIRKRIRRMHDFHMHLEKIKGNPVLENAARRWNPFYWRQQGEHLAGRGRESHELLAAWTAACTNALGYVTGLRPEILQGRSYIPFVPGFIISGDESEGRVMGQHKFLRDGRHALLVNPILADGKIAYDLRRLHNGEGKFGLQTFILTALHEACHTLRSSRNSRNAHDDDFANLLTSVAASVDYAKMGREILDAINSVRALYGAKEARIQSFEDLAALRTVIEDKPIENGHADIEKAGRRQRRRPAERALAAAYPVATSVLGALAAPENQALPADAARAALAQAIVPVTETETVVNVEILSKIDEELGKAVQNDWVPPSNVNNAIQTETSMSTSLDDIDADLGGSELKESQTVVSSLDQLLETEAQRTTQEAENRQTDLGQSSGPDDSLEESFRP